MTADIEKLKVLALAAEQMFGKWFSKFQAVDGISDDDAVEFIAACSPATVLELIADHDKTSQERDELRAEVERLRAELQIALDNATRQNIAAAKVMRGRSELRAAPAAGTEKDAADYALPKGWVKW